MLPRENNTKCANILSFDYPAFSLISFSSHSEVSPETDFLPWYPKEKNSEGCHESVKTKSIFDAARFRRSTRGDDSAFKTGTIQ